MAETKHLRLVNGEDRRMLKALCLTGSILDLHPNQKRLVEQTYNGPASLVGVSGSGKTSVLVHRADYLAKRYPQQSILVLTLNTALSCLIRELLSGLCAPAVRSRIKVMTIHQYCYRVLKTITPGRLAEKQDPQSGEDMASCWHDFMRKPDSVKIVEPILTALQSRRDDVDGPAYVLDELTWIRSGFGRDERDRYLNCDRIGRGVPLPTLQTPEGKTNDDSELEMPLDSRLRLIDLLTQYEEYMAFGGLLDDCGVALEAFSLRKQMKSFDVLRARCVLIDEFQDCSSVELAVVAEIPTEEENGLFLTGDPVQKVSSTQHDLDRAGIDIEGRETILNQNYRNSRQILEAAFAIVETYRDVAPVQEENVISPKFSSHEGPRPCIYSCSSQDEQTELLTRFLSLTSPEEFDSTCIVSPREQSLNDFEEICAARDWEVFRISGEMNQDEIIGKGGIKLSLMQDVKGYEFNQVYLLDLTDLHLLREKMPWEERWRVAFQMYVAMTRARERLVMSYVLNRSTFLGQLGNTVEDCEARDLCSASAHSTAGPEDLIESQLKHVQPAVQSSLNESVAMETTASVTFAQQRGNSEIAHAPEEHEPHRPQTNANWLYTKLRLAIRRTLEFLVRLVQRRPHD